MSSVPKVTSGNSLEVFSQPALSSFLRGSAGCIFLDLEKLLNSMYSSPTELFHAIQNCDPALNLLSFAFKGIEPGDKMIVLERTRLRVHKDIIFGGLADYIHAVPALQHKAPQLATALYVYFSYVNPPLWPGRKIGLRDGTVHVEA
jgi:hypothetical protein